MFFKKNNRASSTIEYAVLVLLFIGAIVAMNKQVRRVFFGRWKSVGDSFGHGQQYDPNKTLECQRYANHSSDAGQWTWEIWYSQACYECCMDKESTSDCTEQGFNGSLQNTTADQCRTGQPPIPWGLSEHWCCGTACATEECNE